MAATSAPKEVIQLVERFDRNRDSYLAGGINEATLCRDYLDKFFASLGWDVGNTRNLPETLKQVVFESPVKRRDSTGFADYCFQIFGRPAFFVEAKLPGADLLRDKEPALQLRRYAYGEQLDVSVLTNFENLLIYNGLIPPKASDPAQRALLQHFTYDQYVKDWPELLALLAPQSVQDGSLTRLVSTREARRGAVPLGVKLLADIERWRLVLAKNIAANNPRLGTPDNAEDLNFAVQQTIDRIVFLRNCEDRGIEELGQLKTLLSEDRIYGRLLDFFHQADRRYNSGLFHFGTEKGRGRPDEITPGLRVDDEPLKQVIGDLYGPYDFSHIQPEILGQVYEQFLGRVIRLTDGHRAKVEEKPEVKKAHGVYYTPSYIVDCIVKNTLGKLLEGRTLKNAASIAILDPACGSGSFLLVAYQHLLDWHLNRYLADGSSNHEAELFRPDAEGARWQLSTEEKKRILLTHIHGVDIDPQAVEVTKLSLLLKVLEGETAESVNMQMALFRDRALPDLDKNIKCGNSLIDSDFYRNQQPDLFGDSDVRRVNRFDWSKAFPRVMDRGGFDAIIGNPPYIRVQALNEWAPLEVDYYKQRYQSASKGNYDIYVVFVEKGLSLLNKNGLLGFILPHKFFNAQYGEALRGLIAKGKHLSHVVHFCDQQVFEGATTYTCLMFLDKAGTVKLAFEKVDDLDEWRRTGKATSGTVASETITGAEWSFAVGEGGALLEKLRAMPVKLEDATERIFQGIKTSADKIYIVEERGRKKGVVTVYSPQLEKEFRLESDLLHPLVKGGDSKSYHLSRTRRLILFPYAKRQESVVLIPEVEMEQRYPLSWRYLTANKDYLWNRENGNMRGAGWYGYGRSQALDVMALPKIFTPDIAPRAAYSLDETGEAFFTGGVAGGYGILVKPEFSRAYVLGLLNSRLLDWFIKQTATSMRGGWYSFESRFIRHLPIRTIDFSNKADKARHDRMVELVTRMMDLKKQQTRAPKKQSPSARQLLDQKLAITDQQIDALVHELYGLTEEEIKIVESK